MRSLFAIAVLVAGCKQVGTGSGDTVDGGGGGSGSGGGGVVDAAVVDGPDVDAAPAVCNGYEPCGVAPVQLPAGYTLKTSLPYDDFVTSGTCTTFEDCGQWNEHYPSGVNDDDGNPYNPYSNRYGQPFPYGGGRYIFDLKPKTVHSIKFHLVAPGALYRYSDGTPWTTTTTDTHVTSCYQRTNTTMKLAWLQTMGGTGELGFSKWTISALPGDMGDSGNVSACQGTGTASARTLLTSDPAVAMASLDAQTGKYTTCLLRDNTEYYLNFMSYGMPNMTVNCATDTCTYGGFVMQTYTGADGSMSPITPVACP
jgi:hypothetical protein